MKELLKNLIEAETTKTEGELAAAKVLATEFERTGIEYKMDIWNEKRANIYARIRSKGLKNALLFASHLDVVEPGRAKWNYPPFKAVEEDGKIYGRGSTDMKGGIAAVVTAIKGIVDSRVKLKGDIVFSATAGEETDSAGAKKFVNQKENRLPIAGVVITEPTDFSVVTAHRGILWLELVTKGKTAHSSIPEHGVNAITSMRYVLNELKHFQIGAQSHELLGSCSMNINTISGGKALNVIPDSCSIGIDIRTIPGLNYRQVIADIEKIFTKIKSRYEKFEADISVVRQVAPMETDMKCSFVKDFCSCLGITKQEAVNFTTDGPHFAALGAPVVIYGSGKPHICHQPNEYIEIKDIEKAVSDYETIIREFLL